MAVCTVVNPLEDVCPGAVVLGPRVLTVWVNPWLEEVWSGTVVICPPVLILLLALAGFVNDCFDVVVI